MLTKQVLLPGTAEATYANATRSFLLRHVRPNEDAQQAAAWAHAHVSSTSLRVFAGFYSGSLPQRQEALEALLAALGNALRQEYSSMWDQNAMPVFVMKVGACVTLYVHAYVCLHECMCVYISLGTVLTAGALLCIPGSASQCNSSCLAAQS